MLKMVIKKNIKGKEMDDKYIRFSWELHNIKSNRKKVTHLQIGIKNYRNRYQLNNTFTIPEHFSG